MTDVGSDVPENVEGRVTVPREVLLKVVPCLFPPISKDWKVP